MAKKPTQKKPIKTIEAMPSKFDYETFFKAIDTIALKDGISKLDKKARQALQAGEKVTLNPYALLALTCSWQSLLQEHKNLLEKEGMSVELAARAISVEGIKEKIQSDADERQLQKTLSRKKGKVYG